MTISSRNALSVLSQRPAELAAALQADLAALHHVDPSQIVIVSLVSAQAPVDGPAVAPKDMLSLTYEVTLPSRSAIGTQTDSPSALSTVNADLVTATASAGWLSKTRSVFPANEPLSVESANASPVDPASTPTEPTCGNGCKVGLAVGVVAAVGLAAVAVAVVMRRRRRDSSTSDLAQGWTTMPHAPERGVSTSSSTLPTNHVDDDTVAGIEPAAVPVSVTSETRDPPGRRHTGVVLDDDDVRPSPLNRCLRAESAPPPIDAADI